MSMCKIVKVFVVFIPSDCHNIILNSIVMQNRSIRSIYFDTYFDSSDCKSSNNALRQFKMDSVRHIHFQSAAVFPKC